MRAITQCQAGNLPWKSVALTYAFGVWTFGPVPLKDLGKVVKIAEVACGEDAVCDSLVAKHKGASLAICAKDGCGKWRQELGIEVPR